MGFSYRYRYRYFSVKYRLYRYRYFPLLVYRRHGSSKAAADGLPTMHWNSQGLMTVMRRLVGRPVEHNREPRRADRANCYWFTDGTAVQRPPPIVRPTSLLICLFQLMGDRPIGGGL